MGLDWIVFFVCVCVVLVFGVCSDDFERKWMIVNDICWEDWEVV